MNNGFFSLNVHVPILPKEISKNNLNRMKKYLAVLCVALHGALVASDTPVVEDSFCADVVETLKVNGSVHSSRAYNLCLDTPTLSWRRDDSLPEGFTGSSIFNSTENLVYKVLFDSKNDPINCTTITPKSPTVKADPPFVFVQLDAQATKNGTIKIGGKESTDYQHLRPAKQEGPFKFPAENMNWYLSQSAVEKKFDVFGTACFETVPREGNTEGSRNFQKNYKRNPAPSKFSVPKGVKCVPSSEPFESFAQHFDISPLLR
jgi:hypothetical protein